jgi:uncharacterized membrane protein YraQ (UPF0718 family)
MQEVFAGIVAILYESAPYLLVGFAVAGLIHVALARFPRVTALLTGTGRRPVIWAALIGLPMSLCSCSVLPAARALRREGASKGATASFLVSVPETDVVSVFATLAMIGPLFAIYRPTAALVTALVAGLVVRAIEVRELRAAKQRTAALASSATAAASCCDTTTDAVQAERTHVVRRTWWQRALHHGFVEVFDDIAPQLVLGIALAGVIGAWLPAIDPGLVAGGSALSYLVMVAIAVPLYVCASASTPIAAGLIAGGASPGAAMVFLLAGPATNLSSLVVLKSELGARGLTGYLASIVGVSIACGVLLDAVVDRFTLPTFAPSHVHESHSPFELVLTAIFLALVVWSFQRTRVLPKLWSRARSVVAPAPRGNPR